MLNTFRLNRWFFVPYIIFLIFGGLILILFSKIEIHWFINHHYSNIADFFFKYFTNLGDGLILIPVIIILLFISYRFVIMAAISNLLTTIFVRLFKQLILPDLDRPVSIFRNVRKLYLVEGVDVHLINSFPSGHSATAFSIFLLFALIFDNKNLKFLFFAIAFLVAYSRMYLSQHFLMDVYFGSIFGVFSTLAAYFWVNTWKNIKLDFSIKNLLKTKNNGIKS
jgi:membrane-associated phospholipid phosphatase